MLLAPPGLRGDEVDGRSGGAPVSIQDLAPEERARVHGLEGRILCDCPRESYTRTLASCSDNCALPQKRLLVDLVRQGKTDDEIFDVMLERVAGDPRVLAAPRRGWGRFGWVIPVVFLALGGGLVGAVLMRWQSQGRRERERRVEAARFVPPEELARVERELAELE